MCINVETMWCRSDIKKIFAYTTYTYVLNLLYNQEQT